MHANLKPSGQNSKQFVSTSALVYRLTKKLELLQEFSDAIQFYNVNTNNTYGKTEDALRVNLCVWLTELDETLRVLPDLRPQATQLLAMKQ